MTRAFTAILLLSFTFNVLAIQCPSAPVAIDKLQKEIDALGKLKEEMLREFEGVLNKDFKSMSEGEKDPALRGTAIKLAFAKNRLNKKIELKEKELDEFSKSYCKSCAPDKKLTEQVAKFCQYCEDKSRCEADQ